MGGQQQQPGHGVPDVVGHDKTARNRHQTDTEHRKRSRKAGKQDNR